MTVKQSPADKCNSGQPLLSIIVLVYNTAEYLPACFDSLLQQSYRPIEIIAIDDASTDNSLAICEDYQRRYPEFRYLSKNNEGGAVAGNLGISLAQGDYVALVDSDDVVTAQGYSLLMAEALSTGADIVIGRAARLNEGEISAVSFLYEPFVWSQGRVVDSVADFPDLIHDGFYWNKVFRRDFLLQHQLGMVPGLLYADRPFVHRAYFLSRCTAIIPQLVYLWRTRSSSSAASITQSNRISSNFNDRMRSVAIEWSDCDGVSGAEAYRDAIAVTNLQRALHVIQGIVASPGFRQVFVEGMQKLLQLYGDLDYRALGPRRCLYLELLKRDEIAGLCYLLALPVQGEVTEVDGGCYWQQPFLNNTELSIPAEVSRIHFPVIGFFSVSELSLTETSFELELSLHDGIMADCSVGFELHALYGEGLQVFVALGKVAAGRYRYRLDLANALNGLSGLHGLVMRYEWCGVIGRYRIGPSLLTAEVRATLPKTCTAGVKLLFSPELGGVGLSGPLQDSPGTH